MILFVLLNASMLYPQHEEKIKKFINDLNSEKNISKQIDILNKICWECRYEEPERGIKYGEKALFLEKKFNKNKETSKTLNFIGLSYMKLQKHNTAMKYFIRALNSAKEHKNNIQLAYTYLNIGNTFQILSEYEKAIANIYKAKALFIEMKDNRGVAHSLTIQGDLEINLKKYKKAIQSLNEALNIRVKINDKNGQFRILLQIAEVYFLLEQYDLSLTKYFQTRELYENTNNKYQYAIMLEGIASNYYKQEKYEEALSNREKALAINIEIKAYDNLIINYNGIGRIYTKIHKYDLAIKNINKGIELANKNKLKSHELECVKSLIQFYESRSDYKKAYTQYKKLIALKETMINEKKNKQIETVQIKYDFESKEKEIKLLKNKTKIKDLEKNFLIVSLIMGFIILIILMFRFYQKVKTNRKLKQQKVELEYAYKNLQKMNKKVVELEKKNLAMAMAITTNHEIKQPLTVIQGYFDLLMKNINKKNVLSDEETKYSSKINKSIEKITSILKKYTDSDSFSIDNYDTKKEMIVFKNLPKK